MPDEHNEIIEKYCHEIYHTLRHNSEEYNKKSKSLPGRTYLTFLYTFLVPIILVSTHLNSIISWGLYIIIFIILIYFIIKDYKTLKKNELNNKEIIIIRLCGISNRLYESTKTEINKEYMKEAKEINSSLVKHLSLLNDRYLYVDRGVKFDKEFRENMLLLRNYAKNTVNNILENKRIDTNIEKVIQSYRRIAYYIGNEKFEELNKFLTSDLNISLKHETKLSKLLKEYSINDIVRFLVSGILLIVLLAIFYKVVSASKLIDSTISMSTIVPIALAYIPMTIWIKTKIIDKLFDLMGVWNIEDIK